MTATPQDELLCTYAALILHDDGAASWMIFFRFLEDTKTVETAIQRADLCSDLKIT